jgi:phosphatidylinositol alpha-1,6-mannosyltransferase
MSNILLIAENFSPRVGGIPTLMENIASYSSHDFTVLTCEHDEADDSQFDFDVIRGDYTGYSGDLRLLIDIVRLGSDFDLLYFAKPLSSFPSLAPLLVGDNTVSHVHGRETYIFIERLRSYARKFFFDVGLIAIDDFIAVSEFTKERLESLGISEQNINVVHNGVEFDRFNKASSMDREEIGVPKDDFLITTVARLDPKKGQDIVMDAISGLEGIHYLIIGTGPEKEKLEKKMHDLGIEDKVTFSGYVAGDQLPKYYKASDLYIMPSKLIEKTGNIEVWGISFLEANAAEKAVIGADNGGMPESIKNGETGLLADNDPEDVREKILKLKEDDKFRSEMERNAVEWAKEHDWPKVIDQIDEIIEKSV